MFLVSIIKKIKFSINKFYSFFLKFVINEMFRKDLFCYEIII